MADTTIEWAEVVWNPSTGCDRLSPGCDNCYALTMAKRLKGMGQAKYQTDGDPRTSGPGFGLAVHPGALDIPLRWRKPRRIFVNSMSDLFHADVPDDYIARVWGVMLLAERHTFQILTKRHARMRSLLNSVDFYEAAAEFANEWTIRTGHDDFDAGNVINFGLADGVNIPQPLVNVWLGVSVEDQKWADIRVPALLDTPAAVRWISAEPLLGPVDVTRVAPGTVYANSGFNALAGEPALSWVVCGGESGPGARPMHPQWARDLRDQCQDAGVPFFLKQWGEWVCRDQMPDDTYAQLDAAINLAQAHPEPFRVGKKRAGRLLDGRTWDEYPEVPR